jgi:hypothetical protein
MPILDAKTWKRNHLAEETGVPKTIVYRWLDGDTKKLALRHRRAIAKALEIAEAELPA